MKNLTFILVWIFSGFLLQTTVFPRLMTAISGVFHLSFLAGHSLDICLLTLMYLAFHRTLSGTLIWGVLFGVIASWFGLAWKGAYSAAFFGISIVSWLTGRQVLLRNAGSVALVAGVLSFIFGLMHLEGAHIFSKVEGPFQGQIWFLIVKALIDAAVAPAVFSVLRFLDDWTGTEPVRGSSFLLPGMEL